MKKALRFTLIAFLAAFVMGCASTKDDYNRMQHDFSRYANLGEAIRSVGGTVTGGNTLAGTNQAVVSMRGQASLVLVTQPLYVVNTVPIGNDYNIANNLVHPANIVSIQVMRGSSASIVYGEPANHGAIIIKTKDYKVNRGRRARNKGQ